MKTEINKQIKIGLATTAGSILGLLVAKNAGWNTNISTATGAFIGLIAGYSLGFITEKK